MAEEERGSGGWGGGGQGYGGGGGQGYRGVGGQGYGGWGEREACTEKYHAEEIK